jgi:hypothetical protein
MRPAPAERVEKQDPHNDYHDRREKYSHVLLCIAFLGLR